MHARTNYMKFSFYERNRRRRVFLARQFPLYTTFPKYGSFFRQIAYYILCGTPRMSRFTANCKCKFDSGFFYRGTENNSSARAVFIILRPMPLLREFVYSIFHAAAANRKRESRNWVLSANSLFNRFYRKDDIAQKKSNFVGGEKAILYKSV